MTSSSSSRITRGSWSWNAQPTSPRPRAAPAAAPPSARQVSDHAGARKRAPRAAPPFWVSPARARLSALRLSMGKTQGMMLRISPPSKRAEQGREEARSFPGRRVAAGGAGRHRRARGRDRAGPRGERQAGARPQLDHAFDRLQRARARAGGALDDQQVAAARDRLRAGRKGARRWSRGRNRDRRARCRRLSGMARRSLPPVTSNRAASAIGLGSAWR